VIYVATIEGWVKTAATHGIEVAYGSSDGQIIAFGAVNGRIMYRAFGEDHLVPTPYPTNDSRWHQLALTLQVAFSFPSKPEFQRVRVYLDGTPLATPQRIHPIVDLTFGQQGRGSITLGGCPSKVCGDDGNLSNVAFYNRVLTAQDIAAHYRAAGYPQPIHSENKRVIVFLHGIRGNYTGIDTDAGDQQYSGLVQDLRRRFGVGSIVVAPYYQDLGYARSNADSPCDPNMPAPDEHAIDRYPYVPEASGPILQFAKDSKLVPVYIDAIDPTICDSEGDLGTSALFLDDELQMLAQRYQHITLMANSMGGAITRGWLALRQVVGPSKVPDLRHVDSVIFIQGAQQGSYISGDLLCSPGQGIPSEHPILNLLAPPLANLIGHFDQSRTGIKELSPLSTWYSHINAGDVPSGIHYYNFYTNIHIHHLDSLPNGAPVKSKIDSIGDGVMLGGSDNPNETRCGGGARFLPGSKSEFVDGAGRDSYQWAINRDYSLDDVASYSINSQLGGIYTATGTGISEALWANQVQLILSDPASHLQLGVANHLSTVDVSDCVTERSIAVESEIERILVNPTDACSTQRQHAATSKTSMLHSSPAQSGAVNEGATTLGKAVPAGSTIGTPVPCRPSSRKRCPKSARPASSTPIGGMTVPPLVLNNGAQTLSLVIQLSRKSLDVGTFDLTVVRVGHYEGRIALGAPKRIIRLRGAILGEVLLFGAQAPRRVHMHIDGTIDTHALVAKIQFQVQDGRRKTSYLLITARPNAATAKPTVQKADAAALSGQYSMFYRMLTDDDRAQYTPAQFVRSMTQESKRSIHLLQIMTRGSAQIINSPLGYTYDQQEVVVQARTHSGHIISYHAYIYLLWQDSTWHYWTATPPPTQ